MKKILLSILSLSIIPITMTVSCSNDFSYSYNPQIKIFNSTNIMPHTQFTNSQMKILNEFKPLFSNINKNAKNQLKVLKFVENDIQISIGNNKVWVSEYIKNFKFVPKMKINFENVSGTTIGRINLTKSNVKNYDFLFQDYLYSYSDSLSSREQHSWPNLSNIIEKITTIDLNDDWNILIPNFITPNWIRANAWIQNEEQIKYWEKIILFYLSEYTFDGLPEITNVKITPIKYIDNKKTVNTNYYRNKSAPVVKFDFFDKDGNSVLSKKQRNKEFIIAKNLLEYTPENVEKYISIFRDYDSKSNFNHTLDIDDNDILFNEYLNTYWQGVTLLKMKSNEVYKDLDYYESFVNPSNSYYHASANSFLWFLNYNRDLFYIEVPFFKRNVDKEYRIKKIEFDHRYLNDTRSLLKFTIEVIKHNGNKKEYTWYSIDINNHYHTFAPYKLTNDLDFYSPHKYRRPHHLKFNDKYPITKVVDPNAFYENTLLKLLSLQIYKFDENLTIFDDQIMRDYEGFKIQNNTKPLHILKGYLGLDIFKYLIGRSPKEEDLLNDIKLEYLGISPTKPGVVLLKVDLLDKTGKSLLSKENQQKIIEWQGFKGTNFTKIEKQIKDNNLQDLSIYYLIKSFNKNLKKPNTIIAYFNWKE